MPDSFPLIIIACDSRMIDERWDVFLFSADYHLIFSVIIDIYKSGKNISIFEIVNRHCWNSSIFFPKQFTIFIFYINFIPICSERMWIRIQIPPAGKVNHRHNYHHHYHSNPVCLCKLCSSYNWIYFFYFYQIPPVQDIIQFFRANNFQSSVRVFLFKLVYFFFCWFFFLFRHYK